MKKIALTSLLILMINMIGLAQQEDKVLARAYYTYITHDSTAQKKRTENMILFLGKNASLYTSYDKIKYEISEDQKAKAMIMASISSNNAPKLIKIDKSAGDWLSKTSFMFWQKEKKMHTLEDFFYKFYLIEEPTPQINWKIHKDTITISGINCQKATLQYEKKNWVAWFAKDIPFTNGPWLLQGLPGLIIEAYDEKKDIQYNFAGFEKAKQGDFVREDDARKNPDYKSGQISNVDVGMGLGIANAYFDNMINIPSYRLVKTTKQELSKLKEAYANDPKGFRKAMLGY